MVIVIAVLVFLAATFAAMVFVLEAQSQHMANRFTVVAAAVLEEEMPQAVRASFRERVIAPIFAKLNAAIARLTPQATVRTVRLRLERAGSPMHLAPASWTLLRCLAILGGAVAAVASLKMLPCSQPIRLCAALVIGFGGYIGPSYLLDQKIKQRQSVIKRALPDVIDLLVVSVEAGLGLDASVQEVLQRKTGPLLDEFARVLAEVRVGRSRRAAWQEMAERVDLLELKVFVAALVQAEELGASIAGVLSAQSEALRVRRSLSVREVAAMLPVKMLFPLIFFIFPSVFVVILGPGMISLVDTFRAIGF